MLSCTHLLFCQALAACIILHLPASLQGRGGHSQIRLKKEEEEEAQGGTEERPEARVALQGNSSKVARLG